MTIKECIRLSKKDIKEIKHDLRIARIDLWLYRLDQIRLWTTNLSKPIFNFLLFIVNPLVIMVLFVILFFISVISQIYELIYL